MSRQQIDRILSDDLSSIDNAIHSQMNTLDMLTGKINEGSGFLAQFQMLLQQQLSKNIRQDNQRELQEAVPKEQPAQLELQLLEGNCEENEVFQMGIQGEQTKHVFHEKKVKCLNCIHIVNILRNKVEKLQTTMKTIKKMLQQSFLKDKYKLTQSVQENIKQIITLAQQQAQLQVESTKKQNEELKLEILKLTAQLRKPLSQISVNNQSSSKKPSSESSFPFELKSERKEPLQCINYEKENCPYPCPMMSKGQKGSMKQITKDDYDKLPEMKIIKVGVPPVSSGFGVLKSGDKVVYKGMWKGGKFQGKGKLVWNNYTYEGDFKEGVFNGYGKLQFQKGTYIGKFVNNKAEGEGTLFTFGKARIPGSWKDNCLIQLY